MFGWGRSGGVSAGNGPRGQHKTKTYPFSRYTSFRKAAAHPGKCSLSSNAPGLHTIAAPRNCAGLLFRVTDHVVIEALEVHGRTLTDVRATAPVVHLACSDDGRLVVAACCDGSLQCFTVDPIDGMTARWNLSGAHSHDRGLSMKAVSSKDRSYGAVAVGPIESMAFCRNDTVFLIVDGGTKNLMIFDAASQEPVNLLATSSSPARSGFPLCASWSPVNDGQKDDELCYAVGLSDGTIAVESFSKRGSRARAIGTITLPTDLKGKSFSCIHLNWCNGSKTMAAGYNLVRGTSSGQETNESVMFVFNIQRQGKFGQYHIERNRRIGDVVQATTEIGKNARRIFFSSFLPTQTNYVCLVVTSNVSNRVVLLKDGGAGDWKVTRLRQGGEASTGKAFPMGSTVMLAPRRGNSGTLDQIFVVALSDGNLMTYNLSHAKIHNLFAVGEAVQLEAVHHNGAGNQKQKTKQPVQSVRKSSQQSSIQLGTDRSFVKSLRQLRRSDNSDGSESPARSIEPSISAMSMSSMSRADDESAGLEVMSTAYRRNLPVSPLKTDGLTPRTNRTTPSSMAGRAMMNLSPLSEGLHESSSSVLSPTTESGETLNTPNSQTTVEGSFRIIRTVSVRVSPKVKKVTVNNKDNVARAAMNKVEVPINTDEDVRVSPRKELAKSRQAPKAANGTVATRKDVSLLSNILPPSPISVSDHEEGPLDRSIGENKPSSSSPTITSGKTVQSQQKKSSLLLPVSVVVLLGVLLFIFGSTDRSVKQAVVENVGSTIAGVPEGDVAVLVTDSATESFGIVENDTITATDKVVVQEQRTESTDASENELEMEVEQGDEMRELSKGTNDDLEVPTIEYGSSQTLDEEPVMEEPLEKDTSSVVATEDSTETVVEEPVVEQKESSVNDVVVTETVERVVGTEEEPIIEEDTVGEEVTVDEEPTEEEPVMEKSLQDETVQGEAVEGETLLEETAVEEEPIQDEAVEEETLSEGTLSEGTLLEETAVEEEPIQDEAVEEETLSEGTLSEGTLSEGTVVDEEPVQDDIVVEETAVEAHVMEEQIVQDEPAQDETIEEDTTKETVKEEPVDEQPVQEEVSEEAIPVADNRELSIDNDEPIMDQSIDEEPVVDEPDAPVTEEVTDKDEPVVEETPMGNDEPDVIDDGDVAVETATVVTEAIKTVDESQDENYAQPDETEGDTTPVSEDAADDSDSVESLNDAGDIGAPTDREEMAEELSDDSVTESQQDDREDGEGEGEESLSRDVIEEAKPIDVITDTDEMADQDPSEPEYTPEKLSMMGTGDIDKLVGFVYTSLDEQSWNKKEAEYRRMKAAHQRYTDNPIGFVTTR